MRPVFIASIGNPSSEYAHTLHSAGHTLLAALIAHLNFPPLGAARSITGTKGHLSQNEEQGIAFWESPSYMNESGPVLHTAWKKWSGSRAIKDLINRNASGTGDSGVDGTGAPDGESRSVEESKRLASRLIVLHDELELPVGKFAVKTGTGQSARGHNGLKSILQAPAMNSVRFTRIGIGIGPRPESREPDVVARYVLWRMTREQRRTIEGLAESIWQEIENIREGKDDEGRKVPVQKVKKVKEKVARIRKSSPDGGFYYGRPIS